MYNKIKLIKIKQTLFNILATIFFIIGIIGIVFPFLPTTPFLALCFLCLCKGSDSFKSKLKKTKFYKNHLRPLLFFKTMTIKGKFFVISCFLLIILIPFILSQSYFTKLIIMTIMLAYAYYFLFVIKTLPKDGIKVLICKQKLQNKKSKESLLRKFLNE